MSQNTISRAEVSELLILPDGQVLVHNLTQAMAEVLTILNPDDEAMRNRGKQFQAATRSNLSLADSLTGEHHPTGN